eukprot:163206-Chlamydomonas_euryale.AAC.16
MPTAQRQELAAAPTTTAALPSQLVLRAGCAALRTAARWSRTDRSEMGCRMVEQLAAFERSCGANC